MTLTYDVTSEFLNVLLLLEETNTVVADFFSNPSINKDFIGYAVFYLSRSNSLSVKKWSFSKSACQGLSTY